MQEIDPRRRSAAEITELWEFLKAQMADSTKGKGTLFIRRGDRPRSLRPKKPISRPLNFRISASFRREFRTYAATHDLKLNELLRLFFDAYRRQQGD